MKRLRSDFRRVLLLCLAGVACSALLGCQVNGVELDLTPAKQTSMDIAGGRSPGATVTFTLTNSGDEATGLLEAPTLEGENPESFAVVQDDCGGLTLNPGKNCTFGVRPLAESNGPYEAKLTVSDGDVTSNIVELSGTASGFVGSAAVLAMSTLDSGLLTSMDITGGASPGEVLTFSVTNSGAATELLRAASLSGADPGNFEVIDDSCVGVSLATGGRCSFGVRPVATVNGSYSATLTVTDGTVEARLELSGVASGFAGDPVLSLTPADPGSLDIVDGNSPGAAATLTVTNTGGSESGTLTAPSFSGADPENFELLEETCAGSTLSAGASCTFKVRPIASHNGSYGATVTIGDGQVSADAVALSGTASGFGPSAILALAPAPVAEVLIWGGQSPGPSTTLTLNNRGNATSGTLRAPAIAGVDAGQFELQDDTCSGSTLAPGGSCTFGVRLRASVGGAFGGNVSVSDGTQTSKATQLAGRACGAFRLTSEGICSDDNWCWDNPRPTGNQINSIWGSSCVDVYAAVEGGKLLHFDGDRWAAVPLGAPTELLDVWGSGASDVYAVGAKVLRFDGDEWAEVGGDAPRVGTTVHSTGAESVWVGDADGKVWYYDGSSWNANDAKAGEVTDLWAFAPDDVHLSTIDGGQAMFAHWDGDAWVSSRACGDCSNYPADLWGDSPSALYAVGPDGGSRFQYLGFGGRPWLGGGRLGWWSIFGTSATDIFLGGALVAGGVVRWAGSGATAPTPFAPGFGDALDDTTTLWGTDPRDMFAGSRLGTLAYYDGAQWRRMSEPPTGLSTELSDVWTSAAGEAYAIGDGRIASVGGGGSSIAPVSIMRRQGADWKPIVTALGARLYSVWTRASDDVYAVGTAYGTNKPVLLHYDGTGWTEQDAGSDDRLHAITGCGANDLVAVGASGRIVRKQRSGSWRVMDSGTDQTLRGVWCSDSTNVYAVGSGGAIVRYASGSWSPMESKTTESLQGVWGSGAGDVFAVGTEGAILELDGSDWSQVYDAPESLRAVWGSSASDVYAVGEDAIYRNQGGAWTLVSSGLVDIGRLRGVWGSASDDVYAVGANGIYQFDGSSWRVAVDSSLDLWGISGSSADQIVAVGPEQTFLRYDGAGGWEYVNSHKPLKAVWGTSNPTDVWAAGRSGRMLRFDGSIWRVVSGGREDWSDLAGFGPDDIYAVGRAGLAHFDGTSWTNVGARTVNVSINAIWGNATANLYGVGSGPSGKVAIKHWDGSSWSPVAVDHTGWLTGVWGSGPTDVFAVGSEGTILHFAGTSWEPMTSHTTSTLNAVWGSGPTDVYAAGNGGTLLHYDGTAWTPMATGTTRNLRGLYGRPASEVMAVGNAGAVLRLKTQ